MSETTWLILSDIPATYDESLESFHCRHPKLPRPTKFPAVQSKHGVTTPTINVLAPPPPIPPTDQRSGSYTPRPQTTMHSGRVSHPANLDKLTDSIIN